MTNFQKLLVKSLIYDRLIELNKIIEDMNSSLQMRGWIHQSSEAREELIREVNELNEVVENLTLTKEQV